MVSISIDWQNDVVQRLRRGDRTVFAELCEALLPHLIDTLEQQFPNIDDAHDCAEIACDVLLELGEHPEKFDPAKGTLEGYLGMAAQRDMLNKIKTGKRRNAHEPTSLDIPGTENRFYTADSIQEQLGDREVEWLIGAMSLDQTDAEIVRLMVDGERNVGLYAQVMGISHLDEKAQREAVNKAKERLKKRITRFLGRTGNNG